MRIRFRYIPRPAKHRLLTRTSSIIVAISTPIVPDSDEYYCRITGAYNYPVSKKGDSNDGVSVEIQKSSKKPQPPVKHGGAGSGDETKRTIKYGVPKLSTRAGTKIVKDNLGMAETSRSISFSPVVKSTITGGFGGGKLMHAKSLTPIGKPFN